MTRTSSYNRNTMSPFAFFSVAVIACALLSFGATHARSVSLEPELIEKVQVQGYYVLLSDLVKNSGIKGSSPLFRSPNPGTTGKISTQRIIAAVAKQGVHIRQQPAFSMVTIKRNSRIINMSELKDLIRERLEGQLPDYKEKGQLVIKLPEDLKKLHVDPQIQGELTLSSLDWSSRAGRFTARFALAGSDPIIIKGTANLMIEVAVARTSISRGKTISQNDIEMKWIKSVKRRSQRLASYKEMIGQSARRQLKAGQPVRVSDLEVPVLIHKNQLVTIVLQLPGLVLRTEGKALSDASKGESVKVLNTQSKRIIHATAKASGLVHVTLASANGSGS